MHHNTSKPFEYSQLLKLLLFIFIASSSTSLAKDCRGAIKFYEQNPTFLEIATSALDFPKAEGEVTADFLVQTRISAKNDNDSFKAAMKKAILAVISQIKEKLGKEAVTVNDIIKWFSSLARDRMRLAIEQKSESAKLYGFTTNTEETKNTYDNIRNVPTDGHYYVFSRISKFHTKEILADTEPPQRFVEIYFKGKYYYVPLSPIVLLGHYRVLHSIEQEHVTLAYEIFADILNNRKFYEKNLAMLNLRLSQAVFILMHHTPWVRGTPSIVESMVEAILRVAYGLTHPPKKASENFWDAMIGSPLAATSVPVKGKLWGFFQVYRGEKSKEEDPEPKPEVFEYQNGWERKKDN